MTSQSFCYWLQGFFELSGTDSITPLQSVKIQQHLNLVFKHEIDPSMGDKAHQDELNKIHSPGSLLTLNPDYEHLMPKVYPFGREDVLLRC